jgi:undecaprenyl-diphosphatase
MAMDLRKRLRRLIGTWPAWHELDWLLILGSLSFGVWMFVALADEVLEGDSHAADRTILLWFRTAGDLSDPLGPGWLEEMVRDFTALGGIGVLTVATLAVVGFLLIAGKHRTGLFVLGAVGSGLALSFLLKYGFDRPRPDLVPHGSIVYTSSFPSGHSMLSALTYLTLGALLAWQQHRWKLKAYVFGVAVLLTLLTGVSRVYLGVHWPTDVLAGWTAGIAWALAWWLLARVLQRRGTVDPDEEGDEAAAAESQA